MANNSNLPEGTDTIVEGAGVGTGSTGFGATNSTGRTDSLVTGGDLNATDRQGVRGMFNSAGEKLRDESKTRARGAVSTGLEKSGTALSNVSTMIDDTVATIEEKLGADYAGYARKASETLKGYADSLQAKDPDELVDDARQFVRKSPGVALAGAAIIGFGLIRLLKSGIEEHDSTGTVDRRVG